MGSLLNDISVFHHKDQIRVTYGRKPVRDHKAGSALHQVIHSLLDTLLCPGIHRGCSLIQNQYPVVRQNCPCYGQKLLLSLGNVVCLLIQHHLVATGL